ncbi:MAG: isoprenyl transferase [Eubacterium sp.]|nr:isoprenyl transferase [Eubacterium sp.]
MKIPTHVSIILDGNGRWAKSKGMPRTYGHTQGAKNIEQICMDADDIGIKYLTVYAFSTENWNRPSTEVAALMKLLNFYLTTIGKKAMKNNMRMRIIGDRDGLDDGIRKAIVDIEELTKNNTGLQFQIAINYGSRDEMIRAMKKMLADYKEEKFTLEEFDDKMYSSYLDTADIPDPDLMIRTSGEERLSNYLMWQHAYSEFYFTKVPWPDFSKGDLLEAIRVYTSRDRRFGAIKEE